MLLVMFACITTEPALDGTVAGVWFDRLPCWNPPRAPARQTRRIAQNIQQVSYSEGCSAVNVVGEGKVPVRTTAPGCLEGARRFCLARYLYNP